MEKLLDLYLSGGFPEEVLTERKERLETTIDALGRERVELVAQLEAQALSDGQIETILSFAQKTAGGLELAEQDFDARRCIIELLDVKATLAMEDSQKIVHASCVVGKMVLSIVSNNTEIESSQSAPPGLP
jgi:hypothetical protein